MDAIKLLFVSLILSSITLCVQLYKNLSKYCNPLEASRVTNAGIHVKQLSNLKNLLENIRNDVGQNLEMFVKQLGVVEKHIDSLYGNNSVQQFGPIIEGIARKYEHRSVKGTPQEQVVPLKNNVVSGNPLLKKKMHRYSEDLWKDITLK